MALTLVQEQRLESTKLDKLFDAHAADWTAAAQRTKAHLEASFPQGSAVRPDDVKKVLLPIIEVDARLRTQLASSKLTQKYWVSDFVDLIIDRVWTSLT
jgi:hypothetical protein